jgi:hypothetical protein
VSWAGKENLDTALFNEFANIGDDTNVTGRKNMGFHVMNKDKALYFTVGHFLHDAECILESGAPVSSGLTEGREEYLLHA